MKDLIEISEEKVEEATKEETISLINFSLMVNHMNILNRLLKDIKDQLNSVANLLPTEKRNEVKTFIKNTQKKLTTAKKKLGQELFLEKE